MTQLSDKDREFLKTYDADKYKHPSVTVDMLIFTVEDGILKLMLIKRKNPPYQDCWAIPGGFVEIDESIKTAAMRELREETGLFCFSALEQLGAYGEVNRDPRTRVISIAYIALIEPTVFTYEMFAGDDAKEVKLFEVYLDDNKLSFDDDIELAFDHAQIIRDGINRLREKLKYTDIAFELLDKTSFTIRDLHRVYQAISGKSILITNFRRTIENTYIKEGKVKETGEFSRKYPRAAKLYKLVEE